MSSLAVEDLVGNFSTRMAIQTDDFCGNNITLGATNNLVVTIMLPYQQDKQSVSPHCRKRH